MNVDKFYGDTLFENYHDLNKNKTRNSNSNKGPFIVMVAMMLLFDIN